MENSQRDLSIDMVVDRFIFNNHIKLSPCFMIILETGVRLRETRATFYCVAR